MGQEMPERINPLQNGKRTVVTIMVTDEDKAFDFFGKAICNRLDTTQYGFEVEQMYLSEERYKEVMPRECREELVNEIKEFANKMIESIEEKVR